MKRATFLYAAGSLLAAAFLANYASGFRRGDPGGHFRTAPVVSTDLVATIAASGTVVPEDVVDVGAQVNGQIASFGTDADGGQVDFRSRVTQGQILARIDPALFDADVAVAEAQLAQAGAQVQVDEASQDQAQAHLDQTKSDWERAQTLADSPALARADFDAARSAFEQAQAARAIAAASIVQGHAAVQSATAALTRARRNLDYCTIRSPVDGVILDRRVDIGQTVVASLNAPSLFLIAKDLRRMTVLVQVNEADIAHVEPGAVVSFSVDAHPGERYSGTVRKVRLNATLTQNVVTYTVEIAAENAALELLPYLTANVTFEIARHAGVLAVPNAALRWSPHGGAPKTEDAKSAEGATSGRDEPSATVWIVKDDAPFALHMRTGLSDGTRTEVEGDGLADGVSVIVGERVDGAPAEQASNPFAPPARGRTR